MMKKYERIVQNSSESHRDLLLNIPAQKKKVALFQLSREKESKATTNLRESKQYFKLFYKVKMNITLLTIISIYAKREVRLSSGAREKWSERL